MCHHPVHTLHNSDKELNKTIYIYLLSCTLIIYENVPHIFWFLCVQEPERAECRHPHPLQSCRLLRPQAVMMQQNWVVFLNAASSPLHYWLFVFLADGPVTCPPLPQSYARLQWIIQGRRKHHHLNALAETLGIGRLDENVWRAHWACILSVFAV